MIDEETGEPVPCPICGDADSCGHWVGTVDGTFGEVYGSLDSAYQKVIGKKNEEEAGWDGDFDVLLRSITDFLEDELQVEWEYGIDPGGPGGTSALRAYYSENVDRVIEQVAQRFT